MPQVQLLAQTYDSITFQYRETDDENAILEQALELLRLPSSPQTAVFTTCRGKPRSVGIGAITTTTPSKIGLILEDSIKWNTQKRDLRKRPSYQLLSSHN